MRKIYISGPMTGIPEYNYPAFFECEKGLKEMYPDAIILNPARIDEMTSVAPYSQDRTYYIRKSIEMVLVATDIYVLNGWESSEGAKLEIEMGEQLGLKIYGNYPTDTDVKAIDILDQAKSLIETERRSQYGNPKQNFTDIGRMWGALLRIDDISPERVALMMTALKLARESFLPKFDNRLDAIGYVLLVDQLTR